MSNKRPRAALYLRVSTLDQSTSLQGDELLDFVRARGWEIFKTYEDHATGTNSRRPMLQECLRDARLRKFDLLVCWKLDRLFRSLKDVVTTLSELNELGIEFVCLKDQIDLTSASGRLMTHLLAAFAEFEASLIRERVRAGVKAKRDRNGGIWGRRKTIDDLKIAKLRQEGLSIRQIAARLDVAKSSVQKSLSQGVQKTLKRGRA